MRLQWGTRHWLATALVAWAAPAGAGPADVVGAKAECEGTRCRFAVTVRHADTGWDHYVDRWEVVAPDGRVLGTRVLQHPHVGEQPFTRSLDGIEIPVAVRDVTLRAHDSVHGAGGAVVKVTLPERTAD